MRDILFIINDSFWHVVLSHRPHIQKWVDEVNEAEAQCSGEKDETTRRERPSRWGEARPLDLKAATFERIDSGDTLCKMTD